MLSRLLVALALAVATGCAPGPVPCPALYALDGFRASPGELTAPGTVELEVSVALPSPGCGDRPGVRGVRFHAGSALLAEVSEPEPAEPGARVVRYAFAWEVVPGEHGVPAAGTTTILLRALVLEGGEERPAYPESVGVRVAVP